MKWFIPVFGSILLLLSGCSPAPAEVPAPTALAAEPSATVWPTHAPDPTGTAIPVTDTPVSASAMPICSPLEGIPIGQLTAAITNPYDPPPSGSDDPHAGIDLSDLLPGTQVAISGGNIRAALSGSVASVIDDRFPFGNAVIIETPLTDLPAEIIAALDLPEPLTQAVRPAALTCPDQVTRYDDARRSVYILYAHMEQPVPLKLGDAVACGDLLGSVGMSGNALNPHLHFETRAGPSAVQFSSISHYDTSATPDEMSAYCDWTVGGQFQVFDPMQLFSAAVLKE